MYSTGKNYGFALTTNSLTLISIRSSEQGVTSALTPVLEVTYHYVTVPEPTALGLLGLATMGLLTRRRVCAENGRGEAAYR
jgi:hypothetical protein